MDEKMRQLIGWTSATRLSELVWRSASRLSEQREVRHA